MSTTASSAKNRQSQLNSLRNRKLGNEVRDEASADVMAPLLQANIAPKRSESEVHDTFGEEAQTKVAAKSFQWPSLTQGTRAYKIAVVLFTVLAFATRFYRISSGNFVLWDEAHFGKFGTHYIDGTFYFDVHPPLGKMLVGLAGKLSGYHGGYQFPSGEKYPDNLPYVSMRMIIASFGTLCVPFNFIIAKNLGFTDTTAVLVGVMTLLEVGLVSITRLILLDSMVLFFGLAVMTFYSAFRRPEIKEFSMRWHLYLLMTGLSLGAASSVKWVGFFITALIGLMTIGELWKLYADWNVPIKRVAKNFAFRALYLIAVPIGVYLFCFLIHFKLLFRSGPGNANMSSLFQAGLEGTEMGKSPLQVAFGSKVTIRNSRYGSGLLHSHVQTFPAGSKQQQVTLYAHSDHNNDWIIHRTYDYKGTESRTPLYTDEDYKVEKLKDGDHVRFLHNSTGRYLHSHYIFASVTGTDLEVSSYGGVKFADPNDVWVVEVAKETYTGPGRFDKTVRSLFTKLRFRHLATGCYLRTTGKTLPEWGFKQGEVTCRPYLKPGNPILNEKDYLWNIESNTNSHLPPGQPGQYKSRFFDDFIDHNVGMWRTNNALTPDPELEPAALTSKPHQWMFLQRGLRMSGFGDTQVKFYMLGNPIVWWSSSIAITILLLLAGSYFLATQRGIKVFSSEADAEAFIFRLQATVGGWAFNYLPYFLMGRVTYLHHYYPSLLYAILSFGFLFDHVTARLSRPTRIFAAVVFGLAVAVVFIHFREMAYGFSQKHTDYAKTRKWVKTWNL